MSTTASKIAPSATPGPWTIAGPSQSRRPDLNGDYAIVAGPDKQIIAEAFQQTDRCVWRPAYHNARLIAAAPDLLAVVRRFVEMYDDVRDALGPSVREALAQADRAIAKAEGDGK